MAQKTFSTEHAKNANQGINIMIKKIALILVFFNLLNSAYAEHIEENILPIAPPIVTVTMPAQIGGFTLGLEGLYQAPTNGNLLYATSANINTSITPTLVGANIDAEIHSFQPEYDWGWHLDMTYHFPGSGNDITFGWTQFRLDSWDEKNLGVDSILLSPSFFSPAFLASDFNHGWSSVRGTSRVEYDALDLVFGQTMTFIDKLALRPFIGVRYVDIDLKDLIEDSASNPDGTAIITPASFTAIYHSVFQGFGPRAGLDAHVQLGRYFSVKGSFAGSLLMGNLRLDTTEIFHAIDTTILLPINAQLHSDLEKSVQTIPELDARLGLNFSYPINPDILLGIELGYDIVNYFNVKESSLLNENLGTTADGQNFAMTGPYFRLQIDML